MTAAALASLPDQPPRPSRPEAAPGDQQTGDLRTAERFTDTAVGRAEPAFRELGAHRVDRVNDAP